MSEVKIIRNTIGELVEKGDETLFTFFHITIDNFKTYLESEDSPLLNKKDGVFSISYSTPSFHFTENCKEYIPKEKLFDSSYHTERKDKPDSLDDRINADTYLSLLYTLTEGWGVVYDKYDITGYLVPENYPEPENRIVKDKDIPSIEIYFQSQKRLLLSVGKFNISLRINPITIFRDVEKANFTIDIWIYRASGEENENKKPPPLQWSHEEGKVFWESLSKWIRDKLPEEKRDIEIISPEYSPYFAIPSHPLMFTLLALFSGKPEKIPRKLLEKPFNERTPEEKKEAEEFLSSIFQTHTVYEDGKELEIKYAIISSNPMVEAKADIQNTLFQDDIRFQEESLAVYIKKTFGAEGLRHLLGLIIGLEENFRQGYFYFDMDEHLGRLGYKKHKGETFTRELKETTTEIVKIFTSLVITAKRKDRETYNIHWEKLFSIDGGDQTIDFNSKKIIKERIKIRALDYWYRNAFQTRDDKDPQYVKLLKKIAQENHREHPLTVYLTPLLAIFWRIAPERKFKVKSLMEWCNLDTSGYKRTDHLKDLEGELNYMKAHGYLGEWLNNGESSLPSSCKDPFNCTLTLTPPEWLSEEIKKIKNRREKLLPPGKKNPIISIETLHKIMKEKKLSQSQLANNLGISRQMINDILHEKKGVSSQLSKEILKQFSDIL